MTNRKERIMNNLEELALENEDEKVSECGVCGWMITHCTTMFVGGLQINICPQCLGEQEEPGSVVADRGDWLYHNRDRD